MSLKSAFNFFGASLNRWEELRVESSIGSLTLKKLCITRWTARIDSVRPSVVDIHTLCEFQLALS